MLVCPSTLLVLKRKRLLVFGEMLAGSGYGDASIASEIGKDNFQS